MPDTSDLSATYDVDMQIIRDYVALVEQVKARLATTQLEALANVETTLQSAAPTDATSEVMSKLTQAGIKLLEEAVSSAAKKFAGVEIAPLFELVHIAYEAVDTAKNAQSSLSAADWLRDLRSELTNGYAQSPNGETLREQLEQEYNANDEGGRGGYIAGIENERDALKALQLPLMESVELAMYESWINAHFSGDCMAGPGLAVIQFDADRNLESATLDAPEGEQVAHAMNGRLAKARKRSLMDLDIVKRLCVDDDCACFEGNNVVRKPASSDENQAWLSSPEAWAQLRRFGDA